MPPSVLAPECPLPPARLPSGDPVLLSGGLPWRWGVGRGPDGRRDRGPGSYGGKAAPGFGVGMGGEGRAGTGTGAEPSPSPRGLGTPNPSHYQRCLGSTGSQVSRRGWHYALSNSPTLPLQPWPGPWPPCVSAGCICWARTPSRDPTTALFHARQTGSPGRGGGALPAFAGAGAGRGAVGAGAARAGAAQPWRRAARGRASEQPNAAVGARAAS